MKEVGTRLRKRLIVKKCHHCNALNESTTEKQKCSSCNRPFLPLNYFDKIHNHEVQYDDLFAQSHELHEDDLIKGLYVLW